MAEDFEVWSDETDVMETEEWGVSTGIEDEDELSDDILSVSEEAFMQGYEAAVNY